MKENNNGNDTNVGSIENSIEDILKSEKLIKKCDECKLNECINCEISWTEIDLIRRIVDNYKRVLKENEELKNAVNIVNKEKSDWIRAYQEEKDKQFELLRSSIPVKEVKDEIEEYKNMLKTCNKAKDIDRIKAINERILELQELIEGRK